MLTRDAARNLAERSTDGDSQSVFGVLVVGGFLIMLGTVLILARGVAGWSNALAETTLTGKPATRSSRGTGVSLSVLFGVLLIVGGIYFILYQLLVR